MNKYICWYAYSGHETEGALQLEEPMTILAKSKAEALFKYHGFDDIRNNRELRFPSLEAYSKLDYAEGGWGFRCAKLDDEEYCDHNIFYETILKKKIDETNI